MKPRALDLFCCAGGVSKGLADAGFDVWGVDIQPQPEYVHPGRFVQGDALRPPFDLRTFDFIWASPPCQAYSAASRPQRIAGASYPDLVAPTREMLDATGVPYCIENVPGAPIRPDLVLDGTMFPNVRVLRVRWFELGGFWCLSPLSRNRRGIIVSGEYLTSSGLTKGPSSSLRRAGVRHQPLSVWRTAFGIDWMRGKALSQAIPPAYAEFIGRAALQSIQHDRRAAA